MADADPNDVVIFIPGIMGSVLKRANGKTVWPPPGCALVNFSDDDFENLLAEDIDSTDILRSVAGVKSVYKPLVEQFQKMQYVEGQTPETPGATFFAWHYDWRIDLRCVAERLASFIEALRRARGDALNITIVAHSMGGLVARTFLEAHEYADQPARALVKRLFTLATPHRGAPIALAHVLGQRGKLWLSKTQIARYAKDPRYPSVYQLLPPEDEPYIWTRILSHDVVPFAKFAEERGLPAASVNAMRDWRRSLDPSRLDGIRVFNFISSTHDTVATIWDSAERDVDLIESVAGGDGTVPASSARLGVHQHLQVTGEHSDMFQSADVIKVLPRLLGKRTLLDAPDDSVRVSLADPIVSAAMKIRGAVVLRGSAARSRNVRGSLRVVPKTGWDWPDGPPPPMPETEFSVGGIGSERLLFELKSPLVPGPYEVELSLDYDGTKAQAKDVVGVRAED